MILFGYVLAIAETEEDSDTTKLVIIRSLNTLCLYNGSTIVKSYKIAVGKKTTPTPLGSFKVVNKVVNPGWFPQGKDPIPAGVDYNPIGTRWIGLSEKSYGIHGTNQPKSIGKKASKGCIRMNNKDVEELFDLVSIGTTVQIIDTQAPAEKAQIPNLILTTKTP